MYGFHFVEVFGELPSHGIPPSYLVMVLHEDCHGGRHSSKILELLHASKMCVQGEPITDFLVGIFLFLLPLAEIINTLHEQSGPVFV